MRAFLGLLLTVLALSAAHAQPLPPECYQHAPGLLGIITGPMQAQACADAKARQAAERNALLYQRQQQEQQRAAAQEQAQRDAAAAQAAAQAQAQRDANARAQAQRVAAEKARAVAAAAAAAQEAAENSPDNSCRKPEVARVIMDSFNKLDVIKLHSIEAIDMEHVTTTKADVDHRDVACHATFLLTRGGRVTGTLDIRPNIAGDLITVWQPDR